MTRPPVIAPIVEGHGEVSAVREIVSGIGLELLDGTWIDVAQPFRLDSGKMRKPDELAKAIRIAAAPVQGPGGVLVLRDGDDADVDCPVQLAETLRPGKQAGREAGAREADAGVVQGNPASAEVLRPHRPQDGQQKQQIVPPHDPRRGDTGAMKARPGAEDEFRLFPGRLPRCVSQSKSSWV